MDSDADIRLMFTTGEVSYRASSVRKDVRLMFFAGLPAPSKTVDWRGSSLNNDSYGWVSASALPWHWFIIVEITWFYNCYSVYFSFPTDPQKLRPVLSNVMGGLMSTLQMWWVDFHMFIGSWVGLCGFTTWPSPGASAKQRNCYEAVWYSPGWCKLVCAHMCSHPSMSMLQSHQENKEFIKRQCSTH